MYTNIIHNDDICNYFLKNQQFIFNSLGNCRECRNQGAKILDAKDKIIGNENFNDNQYFSELLKNLQVLFNGGFINQEKYDAIINILKN